MIHARDDYNVRIQDIENKIPKNEPVFLIRAQDITAARVVNYWAAMAKHYGADDDIVELAREQAERMKNWHAKKIPDIPK